MAESRSLPISRDRMIFLAGAAGISAIAWRYPASMSRNHLHAPASFEIAFVMWGIMMIAMMLPSALPFVWAFGGRTPPAATAEFAVRFRGRFSRRLLRIVDRVQRARGRAQADVAW